MAKRTKEEAYRAGFENPLAGDIGPLQRLYGTVQAIGEELGGADMGTPFGERFGRRQAATKAEVKRLQALRAAFPEEFGRGQMVAQDRLDPYMLDLGIGTGRAMRPGATAFSPTEAEPMPAYGGELGYRQRGRMPSPPGETIEMGAPYWPNAVPRGMNRFKANTFGMTYRRPGNEMYRYSNMDFVPTVAEGSAEEMGGGAVAPFRQGGLVYEPVGAAEAPGLGYARGPIEGEFTDVYGIGGPREGAGMLGGPRGYGGGLDFGVTREGMAAAPSGRMFDPRVAAGAAGLGYLAGMPMERQTVATAGQAMPRGAVQLPPIDVFGRQGATALSGQAPGAGTAFEAPRPALRPQGKGKAKGKSAPMPPRREAETSAPTNAFDPNLNYLVTQAIDQMLGQREAERGREYQEYYATNPWPY